MLMPSALSCDSSHRPPVTRLRSSLFASPPSSPPASAQSTIGNIVNSCRALQSILTTTTAPDDSGSMPSSLPTPPLSHAALPAPTGPMKLRLRSSKKNGNGELLPRKKVVKRAPPRGVNKRRRALDDDMGRDENSSDGEYEEELPSTPKRARIAPEVLPLGLERSDFHSLQKGDSQESGSSQGTEAEVEADGTEWSKEDDQVLVELVLEKLKLSKSDWEEIGKSFGNIGNRKDRNSCGRRWKTLMANGDIGLKTRSRRGKIHGTWR
ncbi:hypothetical protein DL766_004866 [Monosporascus sp. MC13-8B]|uniref:Myb-like domain-containing protein n=1 Tax=Monosporascus cannonballus TaxID=155416 RepID=A0ABY0HFF3_9PEZI|nr:hypothetical protein DL762_001775 [Monosporascus cannonballus]RYO99905.1 hypothetical protein DL763_001188 [Monosporascus cannonballus]RYP30473.1 hypothetical protein DL766_004866 [Monosporascus sp. MC13-8B]